MSSESKAVSEMDAKVVCLGKTSDGYAFCTIKWDGKRLSITGVIGPKSNGDCRGSCGQIVDSLKMESYCTGWDEVKVARFQEIWNVWHLNDMRAGCEHQRKLPEFKAVRLPNGGWNCHKYPDEGGILCKPCPTCGHEYGSKWLHEDVPGEVIEWLFALPESERTLPSCWSK